MIYKTLKTAFIMLAMTGCATQKPFTYNQKASLAMNIAVAAGMDQGLKDTEVPKSEINGGTSNIPLGLASGVAGLSAPVGGLTNAQAGALNLASWLIAPDLPATKSGVIAWLPNKGQSKEEAQKELGDIFSEAASKVYQELNLATKTDHRFIGKEQYMTSVQAFGTTNICPKENGKATCDIAFLTAIPEIASTSPPFIKNGSNFIFRNVVGFNTSIVLPQKTKTGLDELEYIKHLSKQMPEWVYLYFAPNTIKGKNSEKIGYPFFLNIGETLLFVTK